MASRQCLDTHLNINTDFTGRRVRISAANKESERSLTHVPELRKNLISLGTLDSNGCSYRAVGGVMRIMKGALVVMKGFKQDSLYLLQGTTVTRAAATASSSDIDSDTTKLWHMHLGHMSERGMDVLSEQGLLGSKKIGKLDFCEHCVFGKQCRVKFSQQQANQQPNHRHGKEVLETSSFLEVMQLTGVKGSWQQGCGYV
ncbi:hypothetical protein RJ640_023981 [Escallonia rubra]|uniref:GAG-pre-integrase domain-containing protein n=1 Tax=Escallonia rubra TaxID=112253 RepID=A0AA88QXN2_9ASTE|nr:hypothetical protein RJ640_023981 [Escallonia rubra]